MYISSVLITAAAMLPGFVTAFDDDYGYSSELLTRADFVQKRDMINDLYNTELEYRAVRRSLEHDLSLIKLHIRTTTADALADIRKRRKNPPAHYVSKKIDTGRLKQDIEKQYNDPNSMHHQMPSKPPYTPKLDPILHNHEGNRDFAYTPDHTGLDSMAGRVT